MNFPGISESSKGVGQIFSHTGFLGRCDQCRKCLILGARSRDRTGMPLSRRGILSMSCAYCATCSHRENLSATDARTARNTPIRADFLAHRHAFFFRGILPMISATLDG